MTTQLNKFGAFDFGSVLTKEQQKSIVGGRVDTTYSCKASCAGGGGSASCSISGAGTSCRADEFNINGVISYRVKCTDANGIDTYNQGFGCGSASVS